jgi:glycosyltransferase involved in cell wall biosynthesis
VDPVKTAIVLPQAETFSAQAAGAVALMVQRLAGPSDTVLGSAAAFAPFAKPFFWPVTPGFWPWGRAENRYAAALAKILPGLGVDLTEIHNRARLARLLGRKLPKMPMALYLHNDPQTMRGAKTTAERIKILARMEVICVSQFLAERFAANLPDTLRAKIHVLPNALDVNALPVPVPAAARLPKILFAGRPVRDKGADEFVAAMAEVLPQLPGWTADMIGAPRAEPGDTDTPFFAALRPQALAAGITVSGYRPHGEVLEAMSKAAIVVVPSRWQEPFGLTALEALACGAALITTKRGGLPEVAGEAAIYADPDIPGDLAARILQLARDPAWRAELSAAGRQRAAKFDAAQARPALQALRAQISQL